MSMKLQDLLNVLHKFRGVANIHLTGELTIYDSEREVPTTTLVRRGRLVASLERNGGKGMAGLSVQGPSAEDVVREQQEADRTVKAFTLLRQHELEEARKQAAATGSPTVIHGPTVPTSSTGGK